VAAFAELWGLVNLLSAVLALAATAFYVGVYTLWLKRRSSQNIVIGGAAGAVPVLVGWAAVTGSLSWAPVVLFAVIFLWTPPHFWALAIRYREDYAAAHVPMLPVVATPRRIARNVFCYTAAMVVCTIAFAPIAHTGPTYLAVVLVAGIAYLAMSGRLWVLTRRGTPIEGEAMRLFGYSITYLTLVFGAMALDVFVRRIH
jgi:protoheme IX farnesyltransferase